MRPEDVLHVEFSTQPRGFHQDEVRAHLQQVAVALRDAQEQAAEAEGHAHDVMGDLQQALDQLRAYEQHGGRRDDTAQIAPIRPGDVPLDSNPQLNVLHQRIAQLEGELREAHARVEAAEVRTKQAENAASDAVESEQLLKRTLVMAQRTADAAIAEARADSAKMRSEAQDASEKVRRDADEYAARVTSEAEDYAARITREADTAARMTQDDAQAKAERVTTEAEEAAAKTRSLADEDAARMRAVASQVRAEAADQARKIADLRRTYAAQARAAIEDHVAAFSELANLPDLPEALAAEADVFVDSSVRDQENLKAQPVSDAEGETEKE